jgi:hypothetical protein
MPVKTSLLTTGNHFSFLLMLVISVWLFDKMQTLLPFSFLLYNYFLKQQDGHYICYMFYYGSNYVWHVGLLGVAVLNFATGLWILLSISRGGRSEQFRRVLCYCNTVSNSPLCCSSSKERHRLCFLPCETLLILHHGGASTTDCQPNSYVLPPKFAAQKSNKMDTHPLQPTM